MKEHDQNRDFGQGNAGYVDDFIGGLDLEPRFQFVWICVKYIQDVAASVSKFLQYWAVKVSMILQIPLNQV